MIRVLIELDKSDLRAGPATDIVDLCRYADRSRIDFTVCGGIDGEFVRQMNELGVQMIHRRSVQRSWRSTVAYFTNALFWWRELRRRKIDLVYLNYVSWGPSLGFAAQRLAIPVVARAGGGYNARNRSAHWIKRYTANCEAQAARLLASPLAPRIRVVGSLVNMERLQALADAAPSAGDVPAKPSGRVRVLFLGQLVPRKGVEYLIRAFARLDGDCELMLVGGQWAQGDYPKMLVDLTRELNVTDKVIMLDHRSDAIALMRDCDVLCLPSLGEARPRVVIEALLCGCCIVATRVGGVPSLVADGSTGILVEPADVDGLATALRSVVEDASKRRRLAQAGKEFAENELDVRTTANNYASVFEEVLAEK